MGIFEDNPNFFFRHGRTFYIHSLPALAVTVFFYDGRVPQKWVPETRSLAFQFLPCPLIDRGSVSASNQSRTSHGGVDRGSVSRQRTSVSRQRTSTSHKEVCQHGGRRVEATTSTCSKKCISQESNTNRKAAAKHCGTSTSTKEAGAYPAGRIYVSIYV